MYSYNSSPEHDGSGIDTTSGKQNPYVTQVLMSDEAHVHVKAGFRNLLVVKKKIVGKYG